MILRMPLVFPLALLTVLLAGTVALAQPSATPAPETKVIVDGKPVPAPGEAPKPDQPKDKPETHGGKPDDKSKKPEEKKPEEKPTVTKRPLTPPDKPDPKELTIRPDAQGRIKFNFRGQPWPAVLDWLATVSGMSLDWQELPADYLNLVTQSSYAVPDARDLINRHLLARGFTMLIKDEVLSVAKIDSLNPGLVPRVEPEQLAQRMPHEYVKVSFALDWLIAEKAVEELKPMLSPNGRLTALKATNRLEALDAVVNLRELYAVLQQEQSVDSEENLVREFVLEHVRADDVRQQLSKLLGLEETKAPPIPMSREQMEMMQQQARAMMELQQHGGKGGPAPPAKQKAEIYLVVNTRRNSLLAHAPPDKMAVIQKAVATIDVPLVAEHSLLRNINRMQVYRLMGLDPETLVKTLMETGDLDPTTRLEVDKKNRAIVAYASLADHLTIRTLIEKLDGSARRFEVMRLRRLAADQVAGTIAFMFGQEEKQDDRRSPWGYYGWWGGSSHRERPDEDQDRFRVDADVENNRLLLWANDIELGEVTKLLMKLGEIPATGGNPDRVRVLDVPTGEEAAELLERIRRAWPSLAPNPLIAPPLRRPEPQPDPAPADKRPPAPAPAGPSVRTVPSAPWLRFADLQVGAAAEPLRPATPPDGADNAPGLDALETRPRSAPARRWAADRAAPAAKPAGPPAPVELSLGPDGRLVLSSQDTAALDLLEELVAQLAPPRREFRMFQLKHASAFWVRMNLQDYFREGEDKDKNSNRRYFYFYDHVAPKEKEKSFRLSKRKPLKFIDDVDTNTVLVVGADAEQLRVIEELVRLWDSQAPADSQSARVTQTFQIRYSKAAEIAEAVKDVYRDLLSVNDRALQQGKEHRSQTTYIFGDGGRDEPERRAQVSFKGKLSIGIDDISNSLIVSAEGQTLLDNVGKMIKALDEGARPVSDVAVVNLQGGLNASRVREVIARTLGLPGSTGSDQQGRSSPAQSSQRGQRQGSQSSQSRSSRPQGR